VKIHSEPESVLNVELRRTSKPQNERGPSQKSTRQFFATAVDKNLSSQHPGTQQKEKY